MGIPLLLPTSGPLEANSLSGGNWPERGVFQSTDGADGYLFSCNCCQITIIKHSWHILTDGDHSISAVVYHYNSGSPHTRVESVANGMRSMTTMVQTGSLMNTVEGVVEMSTV